MTRYAVTINQGTTSTRFIVNDPYGNIVAVDQKEHQQIFSCPGWVEHGNLRDQPGAKWEPQMEFSAADQ